MSEYPEHEKLDKVKDISQKIGEFLDWLQNEDGVSLCKPAKPFGEDGITCFCPTHESIESMLARYFEIDLSELNKEKARMLEAIRIREKTTKT